MDVLFFVCGKCGRYHFIHWRGDCQAPHQSFDKAELDKAYGPGGWKEAFNLKALQQ